MPIPLSEPISWAVRKTSPKLFFALRRAEVALRAQRASSNTQREELAQKRLMRALCDPRGRTLDVGAHLGDYAVVLAERSGSLVLFEPLHDLALKLHALAAGAPCPCTVEEVALSDRAGEAMLQVPKGFRQSSSLEPDNQHVQRLAGKVGLTTVTIRTRPLDDYAYDQIQLMKIDVEGHQVALLDGAAQTLARCKPHIFIEIDNAQFPNAIETVPARLSACGYQGFFLISSVLFPIEAFREDLYHAPSNTKRGRLRIRDFFFFHRDRLEEVKARCGSTIFASTN